MEGPGGTPKRHWPGRCEFPLTDAIERGHVSTFGRKCRTTGCKSDMSKAQPHELWCQECKRLDAIRERSRA